MPSMIDNWRSKESLILLRSWAQEGMTDEQLAKKMRISRGTLYNWKQKSPEIRKALASGKEVIDAAVENALLKQALDGNMAAICFWLKNRRPDKWRDRPDTESSASVTIVIKDDYGDEDDGG